MRYARMIVGAVLAVLFTGTLLGTLLLAYLGLLATDIGAFEYIIIVGGLLPNALLALLIIAFACVLYLVFWRRKEN